MLFCTTLKPRGCAVLWSSADKCAYPRLPVVGQSTEAWKVRLKGPCAAIYATQWAACSLSPALCLDALSHSHPFAGSKPSALHTVS